MDIKFILDERVKRYKRPEFIARDPICVPHRFDKREDVEISALLTATLAWGRREQIIRSAQRLMSLMG
ncbi:MAG: DUF2400 family protein, partial [Bacteroidia bacterium]|nr:DUF2400 family protein [Bacteroidia bacterium]